MTDNASRKRRADGYQPKWDIDLEYGAQGELIVTDIAKAVKDGMVEVKRDSRFWQTGCFYIEYQCLRASGWEKSGLATTDALVWAFVIGDTESAFFVPTELLKVFCRHLRQKAKDHDGRPYLVEQTKGSHPTKGVRMPLGEFIEWLRVYQQRLNRGAA